MPADEGLSLLRQPLDSPAAAPPEPRNALLQCALAMVGSRRYPARSAFNRQQGDAVSRLVEFPIDIGSDANVAADFKARQECRDEERNAILDA